MTDDLIGVAEDSVRGGFFLFSGTAFATIIMGIGTILIARLMTPEFYGQYTLSLVIPQLLYLFTELGINQGVTKFTAELSIKGESEKVKRIIKNGLLLRISSGIIISLVNFFAADLFASLILQRPELAPYLRIASASIIFQVIFTTAISAFVGVDKTEYSAITSNFQAISKALISLAFVLMGFTITGALIGYISSYAISAGIGLVLLYLFFHKKSYNPKNSHFKEDTKILLKYGAPLFISILLAGFVPFYRNLMLALFTSDIAIGNYRAAINFASLMTILAIPITTILMPAFSKLGDMPKKTIINFFRIVNKYTALLIIPATFLIITFSNEIVSVAYGSTYQLASNYLGLYCLVYFLVGIGYLTLYSLFNGIGKTKITFRVSMITFLILIALSPLLTSWYGVQGLIAAFLVATTTGEIYSLYYATKKIGIKFDISALLKIYAVSVLSTIFPILILTFANLPALFSLIIGSLLYLFVYLTLIPLIRTISLGEIEQANLMLQKVPILNLITNPLMKYQQKILQSKLVRKKSSNAS